jgi:hypothetical protein
MDSRVAGLIESCDVALLLALLALLPCSPALPVLLLETMFGSHDRSQIIALCGEPSELSTEPFLLFCVPNNSVTYGERLGRSTKLVLNMPLPTEDEPRGGCTA